MRRKLTPKEKFLVLLPALAFIGSLLLVIVIVRVVTQEGPPNPATLPACEYEDSDNCIWQADERGNGEGQSFIAYRGEVYYLEH